MHLRFTALALLLAGAAHAQTIQEYGEKCERLIGPVPAFDCNDGEVVPVTVNGVVQPYGTAVNKCDKPNMLNQNCVTGSRVGRIWTGDPDVELVFVCRRYNESTPADYYQDIAVIHHRKSTGATCWYQSPVSVAHYGRRVPPPSEQALPAGVSPDAESASTLWSSPTSAAGITCVGCHENDPYMHTPYIDQITDCTFTTDGSAVPTGQKSCVPRLASNKNHPYASVALPHPSNPLLPGPFEDWPTPKRINPQGNTCTTCHTIATSAPAGQFTCDILLENSTGQHIGGGNLGPTYWMPPGNTGSSHSAAITQLKTCCEAIKNGASVPASCNVSDITGDADDPDFEISQLSSHLSNSVAQVRARVRNAGSLDRDNVVVRLVSNAGSPISTTLSLKAKQSDWVSFAVYVPAGATSLLTVTVDPDNLHPEPNELNNSASTYVANLIQLLPEFDVRLRDWLFEPQRRLRFLNPLCPYVYPDPDGGPCSGLRALGDIVGSIPGGGPVPDPRPFAEKAMAELERLLNESFPVDPEAVEAAMAALEPALAGEEPDLVPAALVFEMALLETMREVVPAAPLQPDEETVVELAPGLVAVFEPGPGVVHAVPVAFAPEGYDWAQPPLMFQGTDGRPTAWLEVDVSSLEGETRLLAFTADDVFDVTLESTGTHLVGALPPEAIGVGIAYLP